MGTRVWAWTMIFRIFRLLCRWRTLPCLCLQMSTPHYHLSWHCFPPTPWIKLHVSDSVWVCPLSSPRTGTCSKIMAFRGPSCTVTYLHLCLSPIILQRLSLQAPAHPGPRVSVTQTFSTSPLCQAAVM